MAVDYKLSSQVNSMEMECSGLKTRNKSENSFSQNATFFEEDRINLQWKGITYKVENGATILNDLSGSSNSGELTAIMGPSGSGKTSLVNILSGFVQERVTGQIFVNGAKREWRSSRKTTCYILQDDHILPRFTVRELITYASELKIPSTVSDKKKQKAIDDCIYGLGLVGQQYQRADTLSGGEKKRLCIAQEIVNNPLLIFLDEPTSGLDSASCLQCILLLRSLAEKGKNIICTIHQPSSKIVEIFDNLYMLSEGHCIYKGATKDLLSYLANQGLKCPKYCSPTDFLTDIAIGLYGEGLVKLKKEIKNADSANDNWYDRRESDDVAESEGKKHMVAMLTSAVNKIKEILQESWEDIKDNEYSTDNFNQFRVLAKRNFLNQFRNPVYMGIKFMANITIVLFLGTMHYNSGNDGAKVFYTANVMFTFILFLVLAAQAQTLLIFPLQRTIFEREHRNGWYSTKMYYIATTLSELPSQIVSSTIICVLLYWLTGHPLESHRLFFFVLSGISLTLVSESIGLIIGATTNVQNGIYISVATSAIGLMLSGPLLPARKAPPFHNWLSHFVYTKYGTRSIFLSLYTNRPPLECSAKPCFFKDANVYLQYMNMEGTLLFNNIAMLIFLVIFRICSFFVLHAVMTIRK